jgi:predicted MFS family arabinose efflux permease
MQPAINAVSGTAAEGMSTAYRRYALATMATVYMVNLMDRGLMALLMQPIKVDLGLSDTQLGFLTGIAFALFYATLGVPIARWADRGNRVKITSLAIGLWGLTVMSCLFVTSYVHLVFARIAAAIGESGCKPPTYSLVGDYFPKPTERTRAMSIYWMGGAVSGLVSLVLGGWLNEIYGWRITFFLMGMPGIFLALLVKTTLREPRMQLGAASPQHRPPMPMKDVVRAMWQQRSCRHLIFALVLFFSASFGVTTWKPVFMIRTHGMGTAELGLWSGLISGVGGAISVLLGGYIASRWFADDERGQVRLSALSIVAALPFYLAFLLVSNKYAALIVLIPWALVHYFFVAPTYALLQRLVADEMRATSMAMIMLVYNLIGMGFGPQIVGLLSDALRPLFGEDSLRYAMFTMTLIAMWSAYHFWQVGRTVKEDLGLIRDRHQIGTERSELPAGHVAVQKS